MAGGPYAWARWGLGDYSGFSCNTLYWLGNVIGNIAIAVSVIGYASVFLPVLVGPKVAVMATLAVIWLAVAANMVGPRLVGTVESATTLVRLAADHWHRRPRLVVVSGWDIRYQLEPSRPFSVLCGVRRADDHVLGIHGCGKCGRRHRDSGRSAPLTCLAQP